MKVKHSTNRRGADDPRPEWRFQQPGESRKEYLKRYQREYHKQEWYPEHRKERIQETKDRRAELLEWYTKYKATLRCKNCEEWRPECLQFHHRDPITEIIYCGRMDQKWSLSRDT